VRVAAHCFSACLSSSVTSQTGGSTKERNGVRGARND
jgi:hypothetical protein